MFSEIVFNFISLTASFTFNEAFKPTTNELRDKSICMGELSTASCEPGQSIITHSALYGRMAVGRCLSAEFGFLGCTNDVLFLADRWCSGRQSCEFFIPNKELDEANGKCSQDLRAYMQMSYYCVEVIHTGGYQCQEGEKVSLTQPEGYLSNQVTADTGCGSASAPWRIEASAGQTINISLIDFGALDREQDALTSADRCQHAYVHIIEADLGINKTICGTRERIRSVHVSTSNVVEIQLGSAALNADNITQRYMIHYTFTGCADIDPPDGAWYRRDGLKALIGCHGVDVIWEITCSGYTWQGEIGNCTDRPEDNQYGKQWLSEFKVAVASAVTGLTLVVIVVGVAVALYYVKRRRRHTRQLPHPYEESHGRCGYATNPHYQPVTFDYSPDTTSSTSGSDRKFTPPPGMSVAMAKSFMPIWRTPLPGNANQTQSGSSPRRTHKDGAGHVIRSAVGPKCACAIKTTNQHHEVEASENRRNEQYQKAAVDRHGKILTSDSSKRAASHDYCSLTKV